MRITLGRVFGLSLLGLVLLLAYLFSVVFRGTQQAILQSAERARAEAGREIALRVRDYLGKAERALAQLELQIQHGVVNPRDPSSIESALYSVLLSDENVSEVALTQGEMTGFDDEGEIQLKPDGRAQVSVYRSVIPGKSQAGMRMVTRHLYFDGKRFVSDVRELPPQGGFRGAPPVREGAEAGDPTKHLTFLTPASRAYHGRPLWSDLHWSQLDSDLPENRRRVEVSVQKAIADEQGRFVGVLRVGLLRDQIDRIAQFKLGEGDLEDPHEVFLCDRRGRLITRSHPTDELREVEDDLRVIPDHAPPEIAEALRQPGLGEISSGKPETRARFGRLRVGARDHLFTFRALGNKPDETQDWIVGIVVPEDHYLKELLMTQSRLVRTSLIVIVFIALGGWLILRGVKSAQSRIGRETAKMRRFEFDPSPAKAPFADVRDVLEGIEQAKTAMRAMGKYVPVDLVRQLYERKSEPVLGGELVEISMMFTDIKGFTTFSEQMTPNVLADALGRYLEVMAHVIQHETGGTIDKYIGDAIMTIWNAPTPLPDHARRACRAALRCAEESRKLFASEAWKGLPDFHTRFGLHRDRVMVGHFGAPTRMNYTAIGDGVNLASRLEGLNKQYGTTILASEAIHKEVKDVFEFRLLDCVAVKGKLQGIHVYELLGARGEAGAMHPIVTRYEEAFAAYQKREFAKAISMLKVQTRDEPSRLLIERCLELSKTPPPEDWSGVYAAESK